GLCVPGQGNQQDARQVGVGAKLACDVEAGYSGQPEVTEDDVRLERPSLLDPLASAVGDIDDMKADLDGGTQALGRIDVVFDDEHLFRDSISFGPWLGCRG